MRTAQGFAPRNPPRRNPTLKNSRKKKKPKPVVVETTLTEADLADAGKERKALPTWGDIKSAFGDEAARNKEINLDLATAEGRQNRKKLRDMMQPWLGTQIELQGKNAARPRATLRTAEGKEVNVYAETEEAYAKKNGLHAKPYWGRPSRRYRVVNGQIVEELLN